ncbi:MAG: hypothetical protein WAL75_19575 [Terracidiphilus sp.]
MTTASEKQHPPALIWHGADRPRIVPGEYTARCTAFQGPEWTIQFRSWKLRLEFVLDPNDQVVSAFYSFGEDRNAPKIGTRSKYYRDWVRANGGPPKRGQEMSPGIFVNGELAFTVQVSDAAKDGEGAVKDDALVYSRIDKILEVKRPSGQGDMQASIEAAKYSPF